MINHAHLAKTIAVLALMVSNTAFALPAVSMAQSTNKVVTSRNAGTTISKKVCRRAREPSWDIPVPKMTVLGDRYACGALPGGRRRLKTIKPIFMTYPYKAPSSPKSANNRYDSRSHGLQTQSVLSEESVQPVILLHSLFQCWTGWFATYLTSRSVLVSR